MNRQRQRWLEEAVSSDRGENAGHALLVTDVRFWFKEEESGLVKEVRAHKQILSFASDVFNREFFGTIKTEDEIEVKDVTQEVFQAMMEAIYNKKPDWN